MEKRLFNRSEYIRSLGRSFKKGDTKLPMNTIFETIPDTVDYRLLEYILENWSLYYHKSPYSHSYYSHKVGWTYKPHESERLSDHWDFNTSSGKKKHCQTINEDPELNEDRWSIGVYDSKQRKYKIILSYPFIDTIENQKKKRELSAKFIKEHGDALVNSFENIYKKAETNKEDQIKLCSFLTSNRNIFEIYVNNKKINGEVLNLSTSKLRYQENGEITNIKFNRSTSRNYDVRIYHKGSHIAFSNDTERGLTFVDNVYEDITKGILV